MLLGIQGKAASWRTMRAQAETDERLSVEDLDALLEHAEQPEPDPASSEHQVRTFGNLEAVKTSVITGSVHRLRRSAWASLLGS